MSSKAGRTVLTIIMDALVLVAVALVARMVIAFFGVLAARGWGGAVLAVTEPLTIPFGVADIKTPYGGVFDVEAALTVLVLMLGEWVLSMIRGE